jgi:hypothetical protein
MLHIETVCLIVAEATDHNVISWNAFLCCSAKGQLTLNASLVAQLQDGSYSLKVTLTSYTGASTMGQFFFYKSGPGRVPVVTIDGGHYQFMSLQTGLRITTSTTVICPNQVSKPLLCKEVVNPP